MTKRILAAMLMLAPVAAYAAIATSFDRANVSEDFLPGAGLGTRYGRMDAAGDFLPGGSGTASGGRPVRNLPIMGAG